MDFKTFMKKREETRKKVSEKCEYLDKICGKQEKNLTDGN